MKLCLDVGNSHIFGGVFDNEQLGLHFRYRTNPASTSDELGIFLQNVLQKNDIQTSSIQKIAISSVVPAINYSLMAACKKYFCIDPIILTPDCSHGLSIDIERPHELGADLIADAVGAVHRFPRQNIVIVDFGTATTISAVSAAKVYLGTVIMPGMKVSMSALHHNAAQLFSVEIMKPTKVLGRTTEQSIQSGLYFGQLGTVREITGRIIQEVFPNQKVVLIGTGGFSQMFREEPLFDTILPDLVLEGLLELIKN
ncbi:MAG: type III pantothenate kinase [Gammaproteobacteria bacterium]|nr:type III pantothenate kinase [Gammaproteobacteria bacterium]